MDDACADCSIAARTVACSCAELNVHFAASKVRGRHGTGLVLNDGVLNGVSGLLGRGFVLLATGVIPAALSLADRLKEKERGAVPFPEVLGWRGPNGRGGRI